MRQERIIRLQKQLRIARKALEIIRDGDGGHMTAEMALEEIEHIEVAKGRRALQDGGKADG